VRDGIKTGALGVSTARKLVRRTRDKADVPGTFAAVDEMLEIGCALGEAVGGVFDIITDVTAPDAGLPWMAQPSAELIRPPFWNEDARSPRSHSANQRQRRVYGRLPAAAGSLMSLQSSLHPFSTHPSQLFGNR
jgi:N-acyl-D-aspartate/D-glutamate deacylase